MKTSNRNIVTAAVILLSAFLVPVQASASSLKLQDLSYTDSLDSIDNPGIGFYSHVGLSLKESENKPASSGANLVHVRCDIAAFSSNALVDKANNIYGESKPLSEDALNALAQTLDNIKAKGHTAIVRVCYDKNYNGAHDCEPDQKMILTHISQLAEVFNSRKDAITFIELGLYGPYGEMHTSKCCTKENVSEALQAMLDATDEELKIGVRTPAYAAYWLGLWDDKKKEFDINSNVFKEAIAAKGKAAYRVGMFNDGYLGTESDYGTYSEISRKSGTEWLNTICKNIPYGGECITTGNSEETAINNWNTIDFISKEGFITHTSYLNISWNYNVVNAWKNREKYAGEGDYSGQTAFKYINDHLGYRLLLRQSRLNSAILQGSTLETDVSLENIGFGNITDTKKLTYIIKGENGNIFEFTPEDSVDPQSIESQKTTEISTAIPLPENLPVGKYSLYMRISKYGDLKSDNNYQCIRFANPISQWDSETGANLLGSFIIADKNSAVVLLKHITGVSGYEIPDGDYDFNGDGNTDILDVIALL